MVETIIKWSIKGIFNADAQRCFEEIQDIGDEIKPEQVVERAKDKQSELHKCFEWNNTIAAEKYRLEQARSVIRHLIVVHRDSDGDEENEPVRFRVMMKNERTAESGYKQTVMMVKNEDEYQKLLEQARMELRAFKKKYQCLVELADIIDLID